MDKEVSVQYGLRHLNNIPLTEMINSKYRNILQDMINDLSLKCLGGAETSIIFPSGKIIIQLK